MSTLATGIDAQKNAGRMLAAAFHRGVAFNSRADSSCEQTAAAFHPLGVASNLWLRMLRRKRAYLGFPYHDLCKSEPVCVNTEYDGCDDGGGTVAMDVGAGGTSLKPPLASVKVIGFA